MSWSEEDGLQPPACRTVASGKEEKDARSLPPAAPLGLGPRRAVPRRLPCAICHVWLFYGLQVPRLAAFHSIFHIWSSAAYLQVQTCSPSLRAAESEKVGRPTRTQRRLRSRLAARLQAALIGPRPGPHRTGESCIATFQLQSKFFRFFFPVKRSLL